jgi:aspartyl-tRNA(Asn)/glutamyl-tRNA(Gln) amidotransferase subunit C
VKISKEEVSYVAHLARLEFNEEETGTFTSQLNDILLYMEKLNLADTAGVEPISHATALSNAFRDDVVQESLSEENALANAPDRQGGCFRVPKVVE